MAIKYRTATGRFDNLRAAPRNTSGFVTIKSNSEASALIAAFLASGGTIKKLPVSISRPRDLRIARS